jgi:hypothetical protein
MSFDYMGEISDKEPGDVTTEIVYQYMEETMKCPYLLKWVKLSCKALNKRYTPSQFELEEYCETKEHRKCPFYLRDVARAYASEDKVTA